MEKKCYNEREAKLKAKGYELLHRRKMNHYWCDKCKSYHVGHIRGNNMEKQGKIVLDKSLVGKYCTKAKRIWTDRKTKRVKIDELDKLEGARLGSDEKLARMVYQKLELEDKIVEHIDKTVAKDRPELYTHNDPINLLSKCLKILKSQEGLIVSSSELSEGFIISNNDLIKEIEQVI